jgi:hypothetical protein
MLEKKLKKFFLFLITLIVILAINSKSVLAIENPLAVPNNHFGIHILQEADLEDAARLVNSSGGDWGYATLVIRKDERDVKRWQRIFDKMRKIHLIPIVRVATRQQKDLWEKPSINEVDGWVNFLNSLNWVIKNRYVIIGNEPNHAKEWGGEINPQEYADYLENFSKKLKEASNDFFILPAGLDASAPNDKLHMSEHEFLKRMIKHKRSIFDYIDGWTSHSYPNPNFSGSERATGRGTIKTFEWENTYLKSLGVGKDLPVFITETGWAHNMEGNVLGYKLPSTIAKNFKNAFESTWKDERIVAITPFVLNYQEAPFDIFSWKKKDGTFYDFYYEIQKISKIRGEPVQINTSEAVSIIFPPIIKKDNNKYGIAYIKNTGQAIWKPRKLQLVQEGEKNIEIEPISLFAIVEPGKKTLAFYRFIP